MSVRALIADDEPLARERVRTFLAAFPEIEVVRECGDGVEASAAIRELRPELVFLDVQMPGLDGFAVLEAVEADAAPAVIFVTAHEAYAVRAFDVHAADYLLKPFTRTRFVRAVERVLARGADARAAAARQVAELLAHLRAPVPDERIAVRTGEAVEFLRAAEIDWVEAEGNYVRLHASGASHLLREPLHRLEARLDPRRFVRVHRSAIVNLDRVRRLEPWFHGEFEVVLEDGTRLRSSRTYSGRLRELIR
ncbi:MAG TPA: LytTR family DNA-binding domain-containing protein [Longimicrobium sp.]|nr:LytTR family DNA-binding domain-containing protein [Longimicrobium sp.]